MIVRIFYFLFLGLTLVSCVSEVPLSLPKSASKIVIEAVLTDEVIADNINYNSPAETGRFVRITYSDPANTYIPQLGEAGMSLRLVRGALVVIRDDLGQVDTLKADSTKWAPFQGYYAATKLVCKVGRTYFLDVWVKDQHYTSSAYMPPVTSIDSVAVSYITRPIDKFSGYGPLLYFKDISPERNYYIVKISRGLRDSNGLPFSSRFAQSYFAYLWSNSVLSDEFLPQYVKGLSIPLGVTSSSYYVANLEPGSTYDACLFSLTREAYDYYSVLVGTFKNDGGAYSPTPASPPSNIKGGALGFFCASSASIKSFTVPLH
jgi:hypothetical protein